MLAWQEIDSPVTEPVIAAVKLREIRRDLDKSQEGPLPDLSRRADDHLVRGPAADRRDPAAERLEHRLLRRPSPRAPGAALRDRRGPGGRFRRARPSTPTTRRSPARPIMPSRYRSTARRTPRWARATSWPRRLRRRSGWASPCCSGRKNPRSGNTSKIRRSTITSAGNRRRTAPRRESRSITWSPSRRNWPGPRPWAFTCTAGAAASTAVTAGGRARAGPYPHRLQSNPLRLVDGLPRAVFAGPGQGSRLEERHGASVFAGADALLPRLGRHPLGCGPGTDARGGQLDGRLRGADVRHSLSGADRLGGCLGGRTHPQKSPGFKGSYARSTARRSGA